MEPKSTTSPELTQCHPRTLSQIQAARSPDDGLITDSYFEQDDVEEDILELYKLFHQRHGTDPQFPKLFKEKHVVYLKKGLGELSSSYELLDASQPWICYWILHSLRLIGSNLSQKEVENVADFIELCQNPDGGFGGGPKQMSHLAATYAAINAIVCLGSEYAFRKIKRVKLVEFIASMKTEDGGFRMHRGGEVDVRAVYCAVVVAKLTNLTCPPTLFGNTLDWVLKCQTYEGGFGAYPGVEAHGGYTFCALATLILLGAHESLKGEMSVPLVRWLCARQLSIEGGFAGRTNKLVDGCYSFWTGACFTFLGEASPKFLDEGGGWLFHRVALQEYILICCQNPSGGLIDKPRKNRDYYHSCYTLSGLSISQHGLDSTMILGDKANNILRPLHPVFNLTQEACDIASSYFMELTSTIEDPMEIESVDNIEDTGTET